MTGARLEPLVRAPLEGTRICLRGHTYRIGQGCRECDAIRRPYHCEQAMGPRIEGLGGQCKCGGKLSFSTDGKGSVLSWCTDCEV